MYNSSDNQQKPQLHRSTPMQQFYTLNILPDKQAEVVRVADGVITFIGPVAAAMTTHAALERAAQPAATVSPRKARRLAQIAEARQGGA